MQKHLIDMTVECMPNIKSTHVKSARLEADRGAWCGTGAMEYAQHVYRKMVDSTTHYTAPPACQRIPSLTIGIKTTFIGERRPPDAISPNGGQNGTPAVLKYVDRTPKVHGRPNWYDLF